MKEKRVTKKAILASLLSVVVCSSMLIGTSYAWFTDSVTSSGNVIQSGTLKIGFDYLDGTDKENGYAAVNPNSDDAAWKDASTGPIFTYDLWEPGYVDVKHVRISNKGTLALKYVFKLEANGELEKNTQGHTLADAIDVYWYDPAASIANRAALDEGNKIGKLSAVLDNFDVATSGHLAAGESVKVTIVLKMDENAGNEYQNMKLGTDFDLVLMAMQDTVEKDSFDEKYDEKANGIPDYPEWGKLDTSATGKAVAGEDTVVEAVGATLTIPANAIDAGTESTLNIVAGQNPGIAISDSQSATTYEITVTPETPDVLKKVELNIGKGKSGVVVYHNTDAMTAVAADNTNAEGYYYDDTTGILTIWSKTFSPFTIVEDTVSYKVATAEELAAAVNGPYTEVKRIELTKDITLTKKLPVVWDNVTIDGKGHKITLDNTILTPAFYGTMRNVTVKVNSAVAMIKEIYGGSKFENVTVTGTMTGDIQNEGAFGTYYWWDTYDAQADVTFENCTVDVAMTGNGSASDYFGAFIGYNGGNGKSPYKYDSVFNFINCKNTGDLTGTGASLFIGNPRGYATSYPTVNITNFANTGKVRRLSAENGACKANAYYGAVGYTVNTVVNGQAYAMADIIANAGTVSADYVIGTGTYVVGPIDDTLGTYVDGGVYKFDAATTTGVASYEVKYGVYANLKAGGTKVFYVTQTVASTDANYYATVIADGYFVDAAWVEANPDANESTVAELSDQKVYTLNGETYYLVTDPEADTNGKAIKGTLTSVVAKDADGKILAAAGKKDVLYS